MCKWVETLHYRKAGFDKDHIISVKEELGIYNNVKDKEKIFSLYEKEGKAYYTFLESSEGKDIVTKETANILLNCKNAIISNSEANSLLLEKNEFANIEYYSEYEIYFDYSKIVNSIVSIPAKAKIDRIIIDHENKKVIICDLKTTSTNINYFAGFYYSGKLMGLGSYQKYRYYRQAKFYLDAIQCSDLAHKINGYTVECKLIVVETVDPFECKVLPISNAYLLQGGTEIELLIQKYLYHKANNTWKDDKFTIPDVIFTNNKRISSSINN